MPSHRISDVATLLGVSDDTVRRWIDQSQVEAAKDDAGRLRIDGASLARFLTDQQRARPGLEDGSGVQSARNHIQGIVTAVTSDAVMSQVDLIARSSRIVSLISTEAVRDLGLEVGSIAVAQVKATNVSIELPLTR
ncbi:TOBE domain-containing protein [Acidipropionibacterium virtanenii]|uniref:Mop domain-containing protein n=1 Tax=Acidipropionibacterium virtanenii TaxID=2057246 RepID=A0A344UY33_9ACTN|nr:TOBE domain-containing protein [Acidipropionibacterium virtanenii]AXE40181.1 hypothetical protein JS278_03047 [Acidipropionibacterium virtanenii]